MNRTYPLIVASVAAAVASSYANAAPPSIAAAAGAPYQLVMAGSSAALSSVQNAFTNDVCNSAADTLVVKSTPNGNFLAFSCAAKAGVTGVTSGSIVTVYYRSEGGSVVGALPIANNKQVKRLNLGAASCAAVANVGTCTVTGVTNTNGPDDSWAGAIIADWVQLGVTDVEPSQLAQPNDYPSNYVTSVWGGVAAGQAGLKTLSSVQAIQQVFGIAVNTSGLALASPGVVNLNRESVANILNGSYTDWSSVPDALSGSPVSSTPAAITIVNREEGSGTRTSANMYFFNYGCGGTQSVLDPAGSTNYYSTGDDLTQTNSVPGAISYASIDNLLVPKSTAFTNLALATLSGVAPTTLAAAAGQYDYWYEAALVPNGAHTAGNSAAVSTFLQADLPNLAAAPVAADINVIPNLGTNAAVIPLTTAGQFRTSHPAYNPSAGVTATATITIYVNPYTRGGNSCSIPASQN